MRGAAEAVVGGAVEAIVGGEAEAVVTVDVTLGLVYVFKTGGISSADASNTSI